VRLHWIVIQDCESVPPIAMIGSCADIAERNLRSVFVQVTRAECLETMRTQRGMSGSAPSSRASSRKLAPLQRETTLTRRRI
jgi:hypothetical protein